MKRICGDSAHGMHSGLDRCHVHSTASGSVRLITHAFLLQPRLLRSSGTLLPLPALYRFATPVNCRGGGSCDSSWNFHLPSLTVCAPPLDPGGDNVPFVRVYEAAEARCRLVGGDGGASEGVKVDDD